MKSIVGLMVYKWNMSDLDWMGYVLQKKDYFSFHHIRKKEHGGKFVMKNGAILCSYSSHPYLHIIESKDHDMYLYISEILRAINMQGEMPDLTQLLLIDDVLSQFEKEHCGDKNKNDTPLIRVEYTKRLVRRNE